MTAVALILWPFVSLLFFRLLNLQAAIAATIIGGYLLLPTRGGFNLPLLPTVDKTFVPALCALVFAIAFMPRDGKGVQPGWMPRSPVILGLIGLLVIGGIGTTLTNLDPVFNGAFTLPGLRLYDAGSLTMTLFVGLIPFLLARKFLATPESHRTLLTVLAVAGTGYAFLALYEIRMSPQLNLMIYGYFPHDWIQHVRGGGFRPLVFLNHALWLAIFLACAALAAFGLWRIGGNRWRHAFLASGLLLLATLVLSKNTGSLGITLLLLPAILLLPFRLQILSAAAVAISLTTFPVLRANDLVPTQFVVETVSRLVPGREASLEYRLRMEDDLLEKSLERPLFGWGGYGRGRVYDEAGRLVSITDGQWIIVFSQGGWVKYVGAFGLLTYAVFALAVRWRRYELDPPTAVMSVVLAANMIDLIPNGTETSVTLLLAGALAGRLELVRQGEVNAARDGVGRSPPAAQVRVTAPGGGRPPPEAAPGAVLAAETTGVRQSPFTRFVPKPGRRA
jgi:hypothetical protein